MLNTHKVPVILWHQFLTNHDGKPLTLGPESFPVSENVKLQLYLSFTKL